MAAGILMIKMSAVEDDEQAVFVEEDHSLPRNSGGACRVLYVLLDPRMAVRRYQW